MTGVNKANLIKFFKEYPSVQDAMNAHDFDTVFKLLSYTEISAADFILLLQDAGINISIQDIDEYVYGIDYTTYISIIKDVEKLTDKLKWERIRHDFEVCSIALYKDFLKGEENKSALSSLQDGLDHILAKYSTNLDKYDYEFEWDDDSAWQEDDDTGYVCNVIIYLANKWNLNFKGNA